MSHEGRIGRGRVSNHMDLAHLWPRSIVFVVHQMRVWDYLHAGSGVPQSPGFPGRNTAARKLLRDCGIWPAQPQLWGHNFVSFCIWWLFRKERCKRRKPLIFLSSWSYHVEIACLNPKSSMMDGAGFRVFDASELCEQFGACKQFLGRGKRVGSLPIRFTW